MYYRNNAGGWNKTHETIENVPRIDSFRIADGQGCHHMMIGSVATFADVTFDQCDIYLPASAAPVNIPLSHSYSGHGRSQVFFLCPRCGERFRFLYLKNEDFLCRKCAMLNYQSQQQAKDDSAAYWECVEYLTCHFPDEEIPDKLDMLTYRPTKPKSMHQKMYEKKLLRFMQLQINYGKRLTASLKQLVNSL